ncbi:MAG TPA: tetratricopeptide repeat protein [Pyrinomonadaceae bacterium]|nr:tetratricopeptide repeat protein [Pyrinomonadaceae bacterium]
MTRRQRIILLIAALVAFNTALFAQSPESSPQVGAGSGRVFALYGELKIFVLEGDAPSNTFFDLILYTRSNEAIARQRVAKNGRYRFNNILEDNYLVAVEFNNVEIARVAILVSQKKAEPMRQDLELEWTSDLKNKFNVGPAVNSYVREHTNRLLYERALREINKNDLVKATGSLRTLVALDPKDFPAWNELGMVYFIQKTFAAAEDSFGKAIQLKPDYITARVNLARVQLAQKNNEGAIKTLDDALKAVPKSATATYFLGEAYLGLRKGSVAIDYLNEAIKLDPIGMANAHLRLATLYNLAGRKELAAIEYNEFLKKKPDYPDAQRLRDYIIANNPRNRRPKPSASPNQ